MKQYITANEVAEAIGVSLASAYRIIKTLNNELESKNYIIVAGKLPMAYFEEKYYGFEVKDED